MSACDEGNFRSWNGDNFVEQITIGRSLNVVLPQVLEAVLPLKNEKASEMVTEHLTIDKKEEKPINLNSYKNKRKKKKKRRNRQRNRKLINFDKQKSNVETDKNDVEVEYIQESLSLHELAPQYREFHRVFEAFKIANSTTNIAAPILATPIALGNVQAIDPILGDMFQVDAQDNDDKQLVDKYKLSKRKLRELNRLSIPELKHLVSRPDVVEMHDITAQDPKLLVELKAYRNTVPVPRHWCMKRKYLQGKRGIDKQPFELPDFIKRTGIMEIRSSVQEKFESKKLRAKTREITRPKLGKIDIDYQKLHDAFFKHQTKPKMTIHGDLYYEGKEYETRSSEKKPGELSEELRTALGMPVGPSANKVPPPWLIAMQRYGPPPSYPNLKIPGLNAPIPESCSFGYHAGGWGKPPVDENGKPLYGDVFGIHVIKAEFEDIIDKSLWGELESESEDSNIEEEKDAEDKSKDKAVDEAVLAAEIPSLETPQDIDTPCSTPVGMESVESIELRKNKIKRGVESGEIPVLYQILPERCNERIDNSMIASTHIYDMQSVKAPPPSILSTGSKRSFANREGTVELTLDISELDLDSKTMAVRYEQQMREKRTQLQKQDLSDMLAEHVARQTNKRRRQQFMDSKQGNKYKEFKF